MKRMKRIQRTTERRGLTRVVTDTRADTEGHSMLTYELGLALERERRRQAERAVKGAGWSASRSRRPISARLQERLSAASARVRSAERRLREASGHSAAVTTGGGIATGLDAG